MSAGSTVSLNHLTLWRHDALFGALPCARTDYLVRRSSELQHNLNMRTAQEPTVEAANLSLWQEQGTELETRDSDSICASESGVLG